MVSVEIVHANRVRRAPIRLPLSLLHVPSAKQANSKPALGRRPAAPARSGKKPLEEVLTIFKIVFVGLGTCLSLTGAAQHAQLGNIRRMPHQSRALLVLDVHPANIPQLRWRRAPSVRRASIIRWRSKAPAPTATPRPNSRARRTAIVRLSMTGIAARTRSKVRARPPAAQVTCVLRKVLTRKMSTATA